MCKDRDEKYEDYRNEGGRMSREEYDYQCDINDYGADESDNDPWDEQNYDIKRQNLRVKRTVKRGGI